MISGEPVAEAPATTTGPRYRIKSVEQLKSGVQVTMEINIHVVGQDRPSVINDLVMLYM